MVANLPERVPCRTLELWTTCPVAPSAEVLGWLPCRLATQDEPRSALASGSAANPRKLLLPRCNSAPPSKCSKVLGELKGGAMKVGQAMSVLEAAMPEELVGPYRATLTKLQEAAPPMPASQVHAIMVEELGANWQGRFAEFNDAPAAAASIGQVHRAVSRDGRVVAVKLQYPGAGEALAADLNQMVRMGRVFGAAVPGLDIRPLLDELRERVLEELDYLADQTPNARSRRRLRQTRTSPYRMC